MLPTNPFIKEALQKQLEHDFPVGTKLEFYEKITPGFKGKYNPTILKGVVTKVSHPFIYVESNGKEYLLYRGEIKTKLV